MNYLKSVSAVVTLSCFFAACSGSSANKDAKVNNTVAAADLSAGDANFSVNIDGVPVSGNETIELQLTNEAFIYPPKDNGPQTVLFDLLSNKKGSDFYSFRFSLPDKEGTYHLKYGNYGQTFSSITLDFNLKSADNFSRYDADSVTVTIDKLTASRIAGTFSGVLKLSADTRSKVYKDKVILSGGRFDIPFSTGNVRPE